jgi:hypothetical protein
MFRGVYKKNSVNGNPMNYIHGDIVVYQGNLYKNIRQTSLSPQYDANSWSFIGTNVLYVSDIPPIDPKIGQQWSKNGKIYTYYYDGNNYSWVELI